MKSGLLSGSARTNFYLIFPLFVCGLAFLLLTPPFQSPDEPSHFERIVQLSQFEILGTSTDALLPTSIIESTRVFSNLRFDDSKKLMFSQLTEALTASRPLDAAAQGKQQKEFIAYVLVSPIPYLPQTAAVILGKLFSASPLQLLYLARLGNLLCGMLLTALALNALEFSPRLRLAAFITAGIPMNLFLMATANGNSNVGAFALCLVALGANLRQKFTRRQFVWYLGFAMALSLSKSIYFPLPLALVPQIWSQSSNRRVRWQRILLLFAASTLPMLIWTLAASKLYAPLRPGVNPMAALKLAMHQPLATLQLFVVSTKNYYTFYKETFIGRVGWHDTMIPYRVVKHYFHALFLVAFLAPRKGVERTGPRLHGLWIVTVVLGTAAAVYFTIFLTWNPVGTKMVDGVQGRHFYPVVPFLFLAAWPLLKLRPIFWKIWQALIIGGWSMATAVTLYCTALRYWIF